MSVRLVPNADLEHDSAAGADNWLCIGEDPAFDIRFRLHRKPHVVIFLRSKDERLDPKVYVDRGSGYREAAAVTLPHGRAFVVTANVGRAGLIRAFRFDPASQPCRFTFRVETYLTGEEAEEAVRRRMESDMADALRHDLGKLPRFALGPPRLSLRRPGPDSGRFADAHYRLAAALPAPAPVSGGSAWLSVVVPVYDAPARYLDDLLRSFEQQAVPGTELILSDDASKAEETLGWFRRLKTRPSVKVVHAAVNGGIAKATNAGLDQATGTWVALLDHDDLVAPGAFKVLADALAANPDAAFLYTDELVVDDRLAPLGVMLKPAYDPVLLTGVNYINHFSVYRRDRLQAIGGLRVGFDGSQDYDLLLRYLEGVPEDRVVHVPYPAYWWRRGGQSFSRRYLQQATALARKAIVERFARAGMAVGVEPALTETLHKVNFAARETDWPRVTVVIPSRDGYDLIARILGDLYRRTDYPSLDVVVVDNGSTDPRVLALYDDYRARHPGFQAIVRSEAFNFARAVNVGVAAAGGSHVLLLNNDIEVIESGWLKEMVSCLSFDGAGIVGAKLLYPSGKIQHAGVMVGFGGLAGHWYLNQRSEFGGPMNRLHVRNSMTCVTAAAMLVSAECLETLGPWDEDNFAIAYNDVDYCMRAHKAGFRIVWTPFACLYHHESASRGSDMVGERKRRFDREKENLRRIHGTATFEDPAINPGYAKTHSTPALVPPSSLAAPRRGLALKTGPR